MAAHQILMATPREVIQGLIKGTLPTIVGNADLQYLQIPQYVSVRRVLYAEDIVHPVMYSVHLVDVRTNESMTIGHVSQSFPRTRSEGSRETGSIRPTIPQSWL